MQERTIARLIPAVAAADGAGVKLRRSLGNAPERRLDPFLMLDEFFSDDPEDYIRGFPSHPHRGFETVTYMLDGHMRHEDHLGHKGDLGPGDVQWMTAGRGIVHSEMPQQTAGRMRGFQLWINLPAKDKMQAPSYRDIGAHEIPNVSIADGGSVRVIAGTFQHSGQEHLGPIQGLPTAPLYLDVRLSAQEHLTIPMASGQQAFLYLYEGGATLSPASQVLPLQEAAVLTEGDALSLHAGPAGARLLVLAGNPLHEPIVQYGPFVMNTQAEIQQALADYRSGTLTAPEGVAGR